MEENELQEPSGLRQALHAEARQRLSEDPDVVFAETLRLDIAREDIEFWLKFASEWGGALYLLDEKNTRLAERGDVSPEEHEYAKRTYRLGMITLSGLYDKLKAWSETQPGDPYLFVMDHLECFFIPGYLDDYSRVHPAGKARCEAYIQRMLEALASDGEETLKLKVEGIQVLVQEYIRNLHRYAQG